MRSRAQRAGRPGMDNATKVLLGLGLVAVPTAIYLATRWGLELARALGLPATCDLATFDPTSLGAFYRLARGYFRGAVKAGVVEAGIAAGVVAALRTLLLSSPCRYVFLRSGAPYKDADQYVESNVYQNLVDSDIERVDSRPLPPGWRPSIRSTQPGYVAIGAAGPDSVLEPSPELAEDDASAFVATAVHVVDAAWHAWEAAGGTADDVPMPRAWTLYRGVCDCGGPLWVASGPAGRETRSERISDVVRVAWTDARGRPFARNVLFFCAAVLAAALLMVAGCLAMAARTGGLP